MRYLYAAMLVALVRVASADSYVEPPPTSKTTEAEALLAKDAAANAKAAAKLLGEACNAKDARGCADLGDLQNNGGTGVAKNPKAAVATWEKSCNYGWAAACMLMHEIYRTGQLGVKADDKRSVTYLEKACVVHFDIGCSERGLAYLDGLGSKIDVAKAVSYFDAACKQGSGTSCFQLGGIYRDGKDKVAQDSAKAITAFVTACTKGNPGGCLNGGIMFEHGEGIPADASRALQIYKDGCALKNVREIEQSIVKDLCDRRDALLKSAKH